MLSPLDPAGWTPRHLDHLLRRAGFGVAEAERPRWEALGFPGAVDALLEWEEAGLPDPEWLNEEDPGIEALRSAGLADNEARKQAQAKFKRLQFQRMYELRMTWLGAMLSSGSPLREKLALFWHGHFATSIVKVRQAAFMWRQNATFRRRAAGAFGDMLREMNRDPAMLVWLDGKDNREGAPNENYARELLELFTLGEGHYTENDIKESARAFTGWTVRPLVNDAVFRPFRHDYGEKTIFGKTGDFNADNVTNLILEQPQCRLFLAENLWTFFVSPAPSGESIQALAGELEASGWELKPALRALFTSSEFYAPDAMASQIKSPVEWLVGALKHLGAEQVPNAAPPMLRQLGQSLFEPPSVKGWDGGRAWITTNTMMSRDTFAYLFIYGGDMERAKGGPKADAIPREVREGFRGMPSLLDPGKVASAEIRKDPAALADHLARTLLAAPLPSVERDRLVALAGDKGPVDDDRLRAVFYSVMRNPRYQVT
jgi:hypothetical protein